MQQIFLSKNKAKQILDNYKVTIQTNFLYFIAQQNGSDNEVNIIFNDQKVLNDYVETFKKEGYYENELLFYPAPTVQELGNALIELYNKDTLKTYIRKRMKDDSDFLRVIWDINILGDVFLELLEMDTNLIQFENKVLDNKLATYNGQTDD